jgi:hypothetical protein
MTSEERMLLKMLARWVADQEDKLAEELGKTSNLADEIRRLLKEMTSRA